MTAGEGVSPDDQLAVLEDAVPFHAASREATLGGYAWWQPAAQPAPALVLLHGWGQDASYHADRARAAYARGWHAVSVALRGWPGSSGDPDDYGLSAEYDLPAVVREVQQHGASEIWVLGYSAGGLAATRGLPWAPEVTGLVTVNAPMNVHTVYRDALASRMRSYYDSSLTPEHWERCSPVTVASRITTPMLAITGTSDAMIPSTQAAEICRLVPSATYAEIEHMRHLPTTEEWRAIAARCAQWMGTVRSST